MAGEPAQRLRGQVAELDRAEQEVVTRRARYDGVVGEWIAGGCRGDRPDVPPELIAAERELAEKAPDARAARHALPAAEATSQAAAERVRDVAKRRDEAFKGALIEALAGFIATHFVPQITEARAAESMLLNFIEHHQSAGDFQTAGRIREMLQAALASTAWPAVNAGSARSFMAELGRDPSAALAP